MAGAQAQVRARQCVQATREGVSETQVGGLGFKSQAHYIFVTSVGVRPLAQLVRSDSSGEGVLRTRKYREDELTSTNFDS